MCRSAFLKTLATLLAGTHAVGPASIPGLPTDARCTPPREPRACDPAVPATAPCR